MSSDDYANLTLRQLRQLIAIWARANLPGEPEELEIRLQDGRGHPLPPFHAALHDSNPVPSIMQPTNNPSAYGDVDADTPDVNLCDEWIKEVLAEAAGRLTGPKIIEALQAAGYEVSDRTVYRRLSVLVSRGELIKNFTAKPPGFGFPENDE